MRLRGTPGDLEAESAEEQVWCVCLHMSPFWLHALTTADWSIESGAELVWERPAPNASASANHHHHHPPLLDHPFPPPSSRLASPQLFHPTGKENLRVAVEDPHLMYVYHSAAAGSLLEVARWDRCLTVSTATPCPLPGLSLSSYTMQHPRSPGQLQREIQETMTRFVSVSLTLPPPPSCRVVRITHSSCLKVSSRDVYFVHPHRRASTTDTPSMGDMQGFVHRTRCRPPS